MTNTTIHLETKFDSAHKLENYLGKCSHLHGHTWLIKISIDGITNDNGFIIDFNEIKRFIDRYDHKVLVKETAKNRLLFRDFNSSEIIFFDLNPTVENLALFFAQNIKVICNINTLITTVTVQLFESENSYAEVIV
jgi:6-pyruvoyltetrahydropterin/6-carboxytetrahydropterin synthase